MSRSRQLRKKREIQARQATPAPPADVWDTILWMPEKGLVPARDWLLAVPGPVGIMMVAIVDSVREAPPHRFPPSNYWHVMRNEMSGLYEARDEHDGVLYRLFCVLDRDAPSHGLPRPALVLLCGGQKADGTEMDPAVYADVKAARARYLASSPRAYLPPPGVPAVVRAKPVR